MNKIFYSVWNEAKQAYVAAAETVSAKGKPSSGVKTTVVLASLLGQCLASGVYAQTAPPPTTLPTGGSVNAGQASIQSGGAHMVIQQSSERAVINWQTFNVGSSAQVQFNQPSAASVTLNRVLSTDPSQIFGRISANGQVILTNPAGVYFGASARVDVGGLLGTTHGISDTDFMAGNTRFERNGSTGSVVNEGELKAALGGYIALLAPEVRNQGAVIAHMGTVALASGEAVDLSFDSNNRLTRLRVSPSQIQALVDNRHAVQAPGGLVIISAQSMDRLVGGLVKNSGSIEATGLQQQGGRIVLSGSTRTENSGVLNVSNAQGVGGSVSLQGERIELQAGSRIDATGATGGGSVLVGANWQGSTDPLLEATGQPTQEAVTVSMASSATIDASATLKGHGGRVVLWSDVHNADSVTTALGSVLAKGGAQGGDGGQVETSGHTLGIDGFHVDTRSADRALGKTGSWLIDPYDYTIGSTQAATIGSALSSSNVVVTTSTNNAGYGSNGNSAGMGNITVASAITETGGSGNSLTLDAANQVDMAAQIAITGDVYINADAVVGSGNISLANGRGLTITQSGTSVYYGTISGTNATFTKNGAGDLGLGGASTYTGATTVNGGVLSLASANRLSDSTALVVNANGTFSLNGFNETVGSISGTGLIVNGAVIRDGLVLWLDAGNTASYGGSGNIWYDLSGNGYNATLYGSPTYSSATSLFSFINNDQYAQVTSLPANFIGSTPTGVTVFTVANFGSPNMWERIVDFGNGSPNQNIILSRFGVENRLNWEIYNGPGGAENKTWANSAIVNNQKMSFAGTADGSNLRIYADGSLNTTTPSAALPAAVLRTNNYIGKSNWGADDTFRGDIGTVMVYNRALSAAEIAKNHQLLFNRSSATLTVGGNNASTEFGGRIENGVGTLNLVKTGSGTLALSGVNNYAGTTTVSAGTLSIGADNRLGTVPGNATAGHLLLDGGKLSASGSFTLNPNRGLALGSGHGTLDAANGATLTYGGSITGSGNLSKTGLGALVLSGANSYTGATYISGGTLRLGAAGSGAYSPLGTTSGGTTVTSGSALDLAGYSLSTAESIILSGTGVGGSGALYNSTSTGVTYSGSITMGADATIKGGSGALTLNGLINGAYQLDILTSNAAFTQGGVVGGTAPLTGYNVNTGSGAVSMNAAANIAGPISVYGGNITLNAGLVATGSNTITLQGSGNVTDGGSGYVSASNLLLSGGHVTLDNSTSNAIGTLAASGVSGLTYWDKDALTIGSVGSTHGISASAAVNVGTQTGDLTVTQSVSTTNAGSTALVLNADMGATVGAGTGAGGNIVLTGSPSISVGTGGVGKLYTGSISASTGLTGLSDLISGSGRFRYYSDESTPNYSTALGTGLYAIYRERPSVALTVANKSMGYGDALPTLTGAVTSGALLNGDSAHFVLSNRLNSTSGNIKAGSYTLTEDALAALGYNLSLSTGTLSVSQKALTLTGLQANDKTYNSQAAATVSSYGALSGLMGTDKVSLVTTGASAAFGDGNADVNKTVTVSGLSLAGILAVNDSANYSIGSQTTTATINPKTLTVAGVVANNKLYDGTLNADMSQWGAVSTGISGEALTLNHGTASFDTANAGIGKTVTVSGYSLADGVGGLASNYQLTATSATTTANVGKALLSVSTSNVTKTYDGNTSAAGALQVVSGSLFSNVSNGNAQDHLTGGSFAFTDKNAGTGNKTVTVTGVSVSDGNDGGNYAITYVDNTTSTINKAALAVTANAVSKTYDGTLSASGTGTVGALAGAGDVVNAAGSQAFTDKNYGIGNKTVRASGVTIKDASGADMSGNYAITYVDNTTSTINKAALAVTANAVSKTYDGTLSASGTGTVGALAGAGDVVNAAGSQAFTDKNYGIGNKTVRASGVTIKDASGADMSGNYAITYVDNTTSTINKAALAVTANAVSKTYDGTLSASGTGTVGALAGAGDVVNAAGSQAFTDKNYGIGNKTVRASGVTLKDASGADMSGNYAITYVDNTTSTINKATLTVAASAVADKVYDGNTTAVVSGGTLVGVFAHDNVTLSQAGHFGDKNVGTDKVVTVTDSIGGGDAGNYTLIQPTGLSANITRLSSVTWVGGSGGNWFDPANWAGGAVPDLANVANVVLASGVTVNFNTSGAVSPADVSAPVQIEGLGTAGSLLQSNGTLHVGAGGITLANLTQAGGAMTNAGGTTLGEYVQSGGSFTGTGAMTTGLFTQTGGSTNNTGDFTVTQGFSQGAQGSVRLGGDATIVDGSGGIELGNLNVSGHLSVSSTGGGISQAAGTALTAGQTSSFSASQSGAPAGIDLDNAGNQFGGDVNLSGSDVSVRDANELNLGTVSASGNLSLQSQGALSLGHTTVGGRLSAVSGNGDITQDGVLTVVGSSVFNAGTGHVTLAHAANHFGGALDASGADITLSDANGDFVLGNINASGSLRVSSAGGAITQALESALTVGGASSFNASTAGQPSAVLLTNAHNDFNGPLDASGSSVALRDANALMLGSVSTVGDLRLQTDGALDMGTSTVGGALAAQSGGGDITQTGALRVTGFVNLNAGAGDITLLHPLNNLRGGTQVQAARALIAGDLRKASSEAESRAQGGLPVAMLPGTTPSSTMSPQPLVLPSGTGSTAGSAARANGVGASGSANSSGITVSQSNRQDSSLLLAVTLPKGVGTVDTGFSFELPQTIQSMAGKSRDVQAFQTDGKPLPAWLKLEPATLRFVASAVPEGAFPMQVVVTVAGQRVLVLISKPAD